MTDMTAGQKIAATVAIIGAFVLMNQCDSDSTVNQPATSRVSEDPGYSALQVAWDDQDMETQANICMSWWEDADMATDLFYTMAIKNNVDPLPMEDTVRVFFDGKCN